MNIVTESISRKREREKEKEGKNKKKREEERDRHISSFRDPALIIRPLTGQIKLHLRQLTDALNLVSPVMMADGFRSAVTSARIFRASTISAVGLTSRDVKTSASMPLFGDSGRERETNDARNGEMRRRPFSPPPYPCPVPNPRARAKGKFDDDLVISWLDGACRVKSDRRRMSRVRF